jgi:hypothetical protein
MEFVATRAMPTAALISLLTRVTSLDSAEPRLPYATQKAVIIATMLTMAHGMRAIPLERTSSVVMTQMTPASPATRTRRSRHLLRMLNWMVTGIVNTGVVLIRMRMKRPLVPAMGLLVM